ncbi:MAG: hypothetical protein QXL34_06335 [Thermosphaera sp.]
MKNKKQFKLILILLAVSVAAFLTVAYGYAQSSTTSAPGTWVSSINIQNMSSTASANVVLQFYDSNGGSILSFSVSPPIPPNGSRSLYVPTDISGLSSGQFSVVASSDVPIRVVVNSSSSQPSTAGAYEGIEAEETALELYFPGLYNNYYGFYSEIVIQNADMADSNVQIQFYNQKTGAPVGSPYSALIKPGAAKVFSLSTLTPALPSGNQNGLFAAKVTSNKKIGGIANIWTSAKFGEYSSYNGFTSGSDKIFVPALYNSYYGFVSSLTVQNIGSSSTSVKVTYSNGVYEEFTLNPGLSKELYTPVNVNLPSGNVNGVFSAKIEASPGSKIVAIVNVEDKTKGSLASYNGSAQIGTKIGCPVVLKSFYRWFSAETVQNVGNNTTNITVKYASGQTKTYQNVPPNGTINVIELAQAGSVLPDNSSVAATFESSGEPLLVVVQENSNDRYLSNPGDYLLAYTCKPIP